MPNNSNPNEPRKRRFHDGRKGHAVRHGSNVGAPEPERQDDLFGGLVKPDNAYANVKAGEPANATSEQQNGSVSHGEGDEPDLVATSKTPPKSKKSRPKQRRKDNGSGSDDKKAGDPSQVDKLLEIAEGAKYSLFRDPDRVAYASVLVGGRVETHQVRSEAFEEILTGDYYDRHDRTAPGDDAVRTALKTIEMRARRECRTPRRVFLRAGSHDGKLYLDTCDDDWRVIEIDQDGWRIISGNDAPVRFRRDSGMRPTPVPVKGGSIRELRRFTNLRTTADFRLLVGWALGAMRHPGPYAHLVFIAEQGAGKSTTIDAVRSLFDPNADLRLTMPTSDHDMFIAADSSHVLSFDNIEGMPRGMSPVLCQFATKGSFVKRKLYTDRGKVTFNAQRPVTMNGIPDFIHRSDLLDRVIMLRPPKLKESARMPEDGFWEAHAEAAPRLLGALLDMMVVGLQRYPETEVSGVRMLDFARWVTACEHGADFGPEDGSSTTFLEAYKENRLNASEGAIEASPVATVILRLMGNRQRVWEGTMKQLLDALEASVGSDGDRIRRNKLWPANESILSKALRAVAPNLRHVGLDCEFDIKRGRNRTRIVRIEWINGRPDVLPMSDPEGSDERE